jgi:beta-lactamase regulating signal transducer with metallopeptidase domain
MTEYNLLQLLLEITWKSSLVIGLVMILQSVGRRWSSASLRSTLWTILFAVLLLWPLLMMVLPSWSIPQLPEVQLVTEGPAVARVPGESIRSGPSTSELSPLGNEAAASLAPADPPLPLSWPLVVVAVWLAGCVLMAGLYLAGETGIRWLMRKAKPMDEEWHGLARELAEKLGIGRKIRLYGSGSTRAAMLKGIWQPRVLMPATAAHWPPQRRRLALLHELAHIRRWDMLGELLVKATLMVYWFNPLVWLAARQLRLERERACDDAVLNFGARPSDYAMELMAVAADLGAIRPVWPAAVISQGSGLKNRLLSVLDPKIRRDARHPSWSLCLGLMVVAVVVPLSSVKGWLQVQPFASDLAPRTTVARLIGADLSQLVCAMGDEDPAVRSEAFFRLDARDRKTFDKIVWVALNQTDLKARRRTLDLMSSKDPHRVLAVINKFAKTTKKPKLAEMALKDGDRLKDQKTIHEYLNELGYSLLKKGEKEEAIRVFQQNVKLHPEASNVYDSLAEAYLHIGKKEKALYYFERSLKLNPDNENARMMIHKITTIRKMMEKEKIRKLKKSALRLPARATGRKSLNLENRHA